MLLLLKVYMKKQNVFAYLFFALLGSVLKAEMQSWDQQVSTYNSGKKVYDYGKKRHARKQWKHRHRHARRNAHKKVPDYVFQVLDYIEKHEGKAPEGYVGGRTFGNYDRVLPGNMHYQEYDVHRWQEGENRGAERLVRGSDGSAWFTSNHYRTFKRIR